MVHSSHSVLCQEQSFLGRYCYYPSYTLQKPFLFDQSSVSSPSSSPSSPPLSAEAEITTIFVVGFPDDMHEREFTNMFMFAKGFIACSLKWHRKEQPDLIYLTSKHQMIGFARFSSRKDAQEATHILNGRKVQEKGYTLKAEMAKKNLHIKPTTMPSESISLPNLTNVMPFDSCYQDDIHYSCKQPPISRKLSKPNIFSLAPLKSSISQEEPFLLVPSAYLSLSENAESVNKSSLLHQRMVPKTEDSFSLYLPEIEADSKLVQQSKKPIDQNPPCNTLYIGNLSTSTNMEEIHALFSACDGYKRMSFRQKLQGPMCFIEFKDVLFAIEAKHKHQGHRLSNSLKTGIRLSFSKNPLFIKSSTPSSSPSASSVEACF